MTNLVSRNNFFQDLFDFRRECDQMFNRMLTGSPGGEMQTAGQFRAFAPAVESYIDKDGKTFHCRISLPGIDPKDVQIHAQGNSLTISGERKFTRSSKDVDFILNEIWYGSFERTPPVREGVDPSKSEC
jgi:HSP20 family protein